MLLDLMDWVGVDRALIMQHNFHGYGNEYIASCIRRWPDRFFGACSLDPLSYQRNAMLKPLIEEHGFRNFKIELSMDAGIMGLHPGLKLTDPYLMELWRQLDEHGMTLMLDLGHIGEPGNQKREILQIVDAFPRLNVSVVHLCYPPADSPTGDPKWAAWEDMLEMGRHPRIFFDVAWGGLMPDDEEYPFPRFQEYVRHAVERVGAEKLIWGSDVTGFLKVGTYRQGVDWVRRHCTFLSAEQKALVLGETARRVYHVEG
jgi:predicted TIM-barrel fold metal-dependent hydrolase